MIRTNQNLGYKDHFEKLTTATLSNNGGIVSIELDSIFRAIEIEYSGKINATSLLGDGYYIALGRKKIIVLPLQEHPNSNKKYNLFEFFGKFQPKSCKVIKNKYNFIYASILSEQKNFNSPAKWGEIYTDWKDFKPETENYNPLDVSLGRFNNTADGVIINDINPVLFKLDTQEPVKSVSSSNKITFYKNSIYDRKNIILTKKLERNTNVK